MKLGDKIARFLVWAMIILVFPYLIAVMYITYKGVVPEKFVERLIALEDSSFKEINQMNMMDNRIKKVECGIFVEM